MVRAWYMDTDEADPTAEHQLDPPQYLSISEVFNLSGVEYMKFDLKNDAARIAQLKEQRGYTYEDEIVCSKECLPNFEDKLKTFYQEHLHTDEEIRLVAEGSGYFDVRDKNDRWIRVEVVAGDMLVLPAGIYHRFTLDAKFFIRAKRFFIGNPVWEAHNRPGAEGMDCRQEYLDHLKGGFVEVK